MAHPSRFRSSIFLGALALSGVSAFADMAHRWSFNAPANSAVANGTSLNDAVSGSPLVIRSGNNDATIRQAVFTGSGVTLPGTTTGNQTIGGIAAYLDLANGIISSKPNLTVEAWITPVSSQNWQRLFDFGRASVTSGPGAASGEITQPTTAPGNYSSVDDLMLSLNNGGTLGTHRLEGRLASGTQRRIDGNLSGTTVAGTEYHYVLTVTDRVGLFGLTGCQASWYRNGVLQQTLDLPFRLPQMSDVNNWVGRSMAGADRCSNMTINELRIYNHALSAGEISASFAAGADPTYTAPVANADTQTLHRGSKALIDVLANDTGAKSNATVAIVTAPSFGTAVPAADGRILYTHTTGSPSTDSFTYRVGGPGGLSQAANVAITFAETLRIPNTTVSVPAAPPATAIQFVNAFPGLFFSAPICLRRAPGDTQRLFVVERNSGLRVIPNVESLTPTSNQVFTIATLIGGRTPAETLQTGGENGFLSIALHPQFATNGYVFLFYSVQYNSVNYQRISRVTLSNPNSATPTLVAGSELILIDQLDEQTNHNGGDMHFGADGYLYISLGDEGAQSDTQNNSQRINKDFFSGLLRIDVDKKPGNIEPNANPNPADYPSNPPADAVRRSGGVANYAIPIDNPYVHTTQGGTWNGSFNGTTLTVPERTYVRSEFYAVGMRNPWRFSFDSPTGELWVGDVGGGAREEVDVVVKGGNYGWAFREGNIGGPKNGQAPANFTTLYHSPPVYDYLRGSGTFQGSSITGGVVYRGTRFASLTGAYIFGDYVSGNIWSLRRTPSLVVERIMGETNIVAFGHDPANGDVLACNIASGSIRRLVIDNAIGSFPSTLSATNLFADLTTLTPAPGLLPYSINLPFWSDHALKSRWFIIPDGTSQMSWSQDAAWSFPAGQIWVKHFDMELTRGNPATKKRIETRLIVKNPTGAYGVSYQWNDAGNEALLVPDAGVEFDLSITVGGSPITQRWRIPSRAECMSCHSPATGFALSSNTRQFHLTNTINGFTGNQLSLLEDHGFFSNNVPSTNLLPRHVRLDETAFPLEARARSWLAVNCSYCHMPGTGNPASFDLRAHLSLAQTGIINGTASNNGGDPLNRLIVPGHLARSIIYNRSGALNGFTRMPPLATSEVDQPALDVMADWIDEALPSRQSYSDWRTFWFQSGVSAEGESTADPDKDGVTNGTEFLAMTNPLSGIGFLSPQVARTGTNASLTFTLPANRSAIIETSLDLATWTVWDVAGNAGLPTNGGTVVISGTAVSDNQFFRVRVTEN